MNALLNSWDEKIDIKSILTRIKSKIERLEADKSRLESEISVLKSEKETKSSKKYKGQHGLGEYINRSWKDDNWLAASGMSCQDDFNLISRCLSDLENEHNREVSRTRSQGFRDGKESELARIKNLNLWNRLKLVFLSRDAH